MNDNFVSARKRTKYTFVKPAEEENKNNKIINLNYYYQICTFPNPKTKKLHMRQFVVDQDHNFVNVSNYQLSSNQYKKFISTKRPNEYKWFSTYDLENVNYPSLHDILMLESDILNTDSSYTGFAKF